MMMKKDHKEKKKEDPIEMMTEAHIDKKERRTP